MANTIVTMTSPDGATLNTAGTYCEGDIEVVPKLQEKTATTGEIVTPDAGYAGLKSVDTTGVFEAGKKSEYDAFWNAYQQNGSRVYYEHGFAGAGWTNETFKPKYFIEPKSAYCMFANTQFDTLVGVNISFAKCTNMERAFYASAIADLGEIDARALTVVNGVLNNCLAISAKLLIKENGDQPFQNAFNYSFRLTNLTIEGTIGQNGFNVSWSPLSKASLTSVVNALSSTTTGLTVTLRLAAVNTAFETSAGAADGSTSEEWTALIATKPNWTINLINS